MMEVILTIFGAVGIFLTAVVLTAVVFIWLLKQYDGN
jgi:hypothetical protein